jgi:hypothetical protein
MQVSLQGDETGADGAAGVPVDFDDRMVSCTRKNGGKKYAI